MTKALAFEWSHGKRRAPTRTAAGEVAPLPASADSASEHEPKTGRFVAGNRAARRRTLKRVAKGLHTLNPAACASWLQPYAKLAAGYAIELAATVPSHPALIALAGDAADARAVYRGLLVLAAKGDMDALKEARGWLREHRASLATLSGLAGEVEAQRDENPHAALYAAMAEEEPTK